MIEFLDPTRFYTNRQYLTQWFQADTLCVTDNDFENVEHTRQLLEQHSNHNRILDITHNPFPDNKLSLKFTPMLTNNFEFFYKPQAGTTFFPLFLWMYSLCVSTIVQDHTELKYGQNSISEELLISVCSVSLSQCITKKISIRILIH